MPEIKAFQGWRYSKTKVKSLSAVYAPPYDVINAAQQQALYDKSPYNIIRLELTKEEPGQDKYQRAAACAKEWKAEGVLAQDKKPSLYVLVQDYDEEGRRRTRVGFLAAMKLDERAVLKHENTLDAPKKDRFALIKQVKMNLSPIFGLFEDKSGQVQRLLKAALRRRPEADVVIDGVRHRLYVESDPKRIAKVQKLMLSKPMYIADGHHRFEVACQFRDHMISEGADVSQGWDHVMTYFSDCQHNPFKIFPTHRLIRFPNGMSEPWSVLKHKGRLERLRGLSETLSRLSKNRQETRDKGYTFGVYTRKDGYYLLTIDPPVVSKLGKSPVDRMDVAVLHKAVIEPCFGITSIEKSRSIDFTRDASDAVGRVDQGDFDAAFFLRPTSMQEMITASKKGLKMPQKSTYFYPKLLTGMVFHGFSKTPAAATAGVR